MAFSVVTILVVDPKEVHTLGVLCAALTGITGAMILTDLLWYCTIKVEEPKKSNLTEEHHDDEKTIPLEDVEKGKTLNEEQVSLENI